MQIVVTVPDQYALDFPANELARRLKLSAALLMFRGGQFSAGAACEFAGVDRSPFWKPAASTGLMLLTMTRMEIERLEDTEIRISKRLIEKTLALAGE